MHIWRHTKRGTDRQTRNKLTHRGVYRAAPQQKIKERFLNVYGYTAFPLILRIFLYLHFQCICYTKHTGKPQTGKPRTQLVETNKQELQEIIKETNKRNKVLFSSV